MIEDVDQRESESKAALGDDLLSREPETIYEYLGEDYSALRRQADLDAFETLVIFHSCV